MVPVLVPALHYYSSSGSSSRTGTGIKRAELELFYFQY